MSLTYRLALCAVCAFTSYANAALITLGPVQVSFGVDGGYIWNASPTFTDNNNGTFSSIGDHTSADWNCSWDMTVKPDPFIDAVFGFRNNTAFTQTYVISVVLPVAPAQIPLTKIGGSVGLTLTDSNFSGSAQVSDAGDGVYFGQNDGVNALELLANPFTLTVNTAGGTKVATDSAGLPGLTISGPAAASTIGIVHRFRLSPGDSVAFTSFYIVEAVPEASTFVLLGTALAGTAIIRFARRRQA
jgi:hypothetical protein